MNVQATSLPGVFILDIVPHEDERGFFARTWDPAIAEEHGLVARFDYACISTNRKKGTLRGLHWQQVPFGETKLVRCTRGTVFDVAVDLRPDSKTFKRWHGVELSTENHRALYIPAGCAHGFVTLTDDAEVLYLIAGSYRKEAEAGAWWDDPAFGIQWPVEHPILSERDRSFPAFS